jgi:hypothetical protein
MEFYTFLDVPVKATDGSMLMAFCMTLWRKLRTGIECKQKEN